MAQCRPLMAICFPNSVSPHNVFLPDTSLISAMKELEIFFTILVE